MERRRQWREEREERRESEARRDRERLVEMVRDLKGKEEKREEVVREREEKVDINNIHKEWVGGYDMYIHSFAFPVSIRIIKF